MCRRRRKESDALSKDLKQRGFKFVGSTIVYAHMQATGLVNDHLAELLRARGQGAARRRQQACRQGPSGRRTFTIVSAYRPRGVLCEIAPR